MMLFREIREMVTKMGRSGSQGGVLPNPSVGDWEYGSSSKGGPENAMPYRAYGVLLGDLAL